MKDKQCHFQNESYSELLTDYLVSTMEKIFDPVPVPIILIDNNTKIKMINDVFANYLGFQKDELIGKKVIEVDKNTRFPYVFKTKKAEDYEYFSNPKYKDSFLTV